MRGFMPKPLQTALLNQAVLLFLKGLASPVVLYKEDCAAFYAELQQVLKLANPQHPKLIEKEGMGPLSRVSFLDTELIGVALQSAPPPGMG
jgi:hypothetical protein